jgi:hypothetical protein
MPILLTGAFGNIGSPDASTWPSIAPVRRLTARPPRLWARAGGRV